MSIAQRRSLQWTMEQEQVTASNNRPSALRLVHQRRFEEAAEQRMRLVRLRLEFGVELHGEKPGVARDFDDLGEIAAGAQAGGGQAGALVSVAVLRVVLVAVAVAFHDARVAIAAVGPAVLLDDAG